MDKLKAHIRSSNEQEKSLQKSNIPSSRQFSDSKSKASAQDDRYLKVSNVLYKHSISKQNTSQSVSSAGKMPMFSNMQRKINLNNTIIVMQNIQDQEQEHIEEDKSADDKYEEDKSELSKKELVHKRKKKIRSTSFILKIDVNGLEEDLCIQIENKNRIGEINVSKRNNNKTNSATIPIDDEEIRIRDTSDSHNNSDED